jgi:type IV pilus assembly protein PilC
VDDRETADLPPLSASTAEAVLDRAGQIAAAGMPLAAGLRIAAAECDSWRLARGLRAMANLLDRGRSLDDCLQSAARRLPPHLAGLIRAAQRTGALGPMLVEWLENRRAAREQWREILAALTYPALSVLLAMAVFLLFAIMVVPPFEEMFEDFGLRLPMMTEQFIRSSKMAVPLFACFAAAFLAIVVAARLFGGRTGWSWLMTNLPLIGNAWHWTGVAEMLRSLGLLVEHRVPLPEALRLTAGGITDAYVASQCRALASRVERGTSLTMSLVGLRTLPLSIVPLVRWGEENDSLAAALRSAAEMIEGRLDLRATLLVQVIPPIVLVTVAGAVASAVIALFLPLISIMEALS